MDFLRGRANIASQAAAAVKSGAVYDMLRRLLAAVSCWCETLVKRSQLRDAWGIFKTPKAFLRK
jgi:hypothetical protein